MLSKRSLPFQDLGMREKQNLAAVALLTFYISFFGWQILSSKLFYGYGGDYLAFWSGGYIANKYGYQQVYDIHILDEVQRSLIKEDTSFSPLPIAFFPFFIIPFQLLAYLNPVISFWCWTAINLVAFILYLNFLLSRFNYQPERRLLFMLVLSLPLFFTLLEGQINVWLAIFVGEFMYALFIGKSFRAGLWLGGLLWKPQTLIFLLPFLVFRRNWKALGGFTISMGIVLLVSLILAGWGAIQQLLALWLDFAGGVPTNSPENMMNWRMVSLHIGNLTTSWVGWLVAGLGIIICLAMTWELWKNINLKSDFPKDILVWVVLGTLAATCAVTWHSHIHMGMILIPPIAYLYARGDFEDRYLNLWLFLPLVIFIFVLFLGILLNDPYILVAGHAGGFLLGFCALFLNMLLLVISYHRTKMIKSAI